MSAERLVQTQDDRLALLALGRKVVILTALDRVEDDVATSFELERVAKSESGSGESSRDAADVLRGVEEPAGDGDVALSEGAAMGEDCEGGLGDDPRRAARKAHLRSRRYARLGPGRRRGPSMLGGERGAGRCLRRRSRLRAKGKSAALTSSPPRSSHLQSFRRATP